MARDRWFVRDFPGARKAKQATAASPVSRALAAIEPLEDRRLLSAALVNPGGPVILAPQPTPASSVTVAAKGHGVTLYLKAGTNFDGSLGDLVGATVPVGFTVSATIDWGYGTAAGTGKVSITSAGDIDVSGSHTYKEGGEYAISIGVTATPAPIGPVSEPIILYLGTIQSTAFVNSSGGVTLDETRGLAFTASVGTFSHIAPAANLHANITWGDGTASSVGTVTSTGVSGLDVINFKVTGSHKYTKAGTFPIVVTVTQQTASSKAPAKLVTVIDSTAVVAAGLDLDGTITGTLLPAPTAVNLGALYIINSATGTAGVLGAVSATGRVQLPPLGTTDAATGSLTLTTISADAAGPTGSVTLKLTGPTQPASDPFPAHLSYTITGGTGDFADVTGSGTIDVTLGPKALEFKFVIHSA